jgi:hypothetical protein
MGISVSPIAGRNPLTSSEFALDIWLDGFERLHRQGWTSIGHHEG